MGYLDSSNATPTRYWDEVTLASNDNFYLEYVFEATSYEDMRYGLSATTADGLTTSRSSSSISQVTMLYIRALSTSARRLQTVGRSPA